MQLEYSDLDLMKRIIGKDASALELLYSRYERVMYSFAYRIVKDAMAAEEVVQELFMRIWKSAERYDLREGKISTWLFAITRNIAIDVLRKQKSRMPVPPANEEKLQLVIAENADTEEMVELQWMGEQVRSALDKLNEEQQEVIELIYYQGYTHQDVSNIQSIPLGTVKSRVRLALHHLRAKLPNLGKEGISG
jgi:RNA polymerase sigma factor (sigma-70 family)